MSSNATEWISAPLKARPSRGSRNRPAVLLDHVQEDEEVARATVENPIEVAATVAAQPAQTSLDLGGAGEGEWRNVVRVPVHGGDLFEDDVHW
jgi:hypothetical protein